VTRRGPGRPSHPQTIEDCQRWLREEIEIVTRRYNEKLEQLRRVQAACDVLEDVAEVYASVAAGRVDPAVQASQIDRAFMARNIVIDPDVLREMDATQLQVADEGGPVRFATRFVCQVMGVTRYALLAQRAHRARVQKTVIDTLAPRRTCA
jgi:hypothetical protein